MIKLETTYNDNTVFYFHTLEDCNKFLYVFKDHWCNVKWKRPVEVPDDIKLSAVQREALYRDPKERAEVNLSWGFSLVRYYGDDKLKSDQQAFLNKMVKEFS